MVKSGVVTIARHRPLLDKLNLSTLAGVKSFHGDLVKDQHGRRDVFRIHDLDENGQPVVLFLKRNWKPHRKDGLSSLVREGKVHSISHQEWENSKAFEAAGCKCAPLVAFGEDCGPLWEKFSFLITEAASGSLTLDAFLRNCRDPRERRRVFDGLAEEVQKLHANGLAAPDMLSRHIFIDTRAATPRFCWIDVARMDRHQPLSDRLRARDLAALNVSAPERFVTVRERIRFLQVYSRALDRSFLDRIVRRVEHLLQRRRFRESYELAANPS